MLYQFPPAVRIYCSHITKPRKYAIPKAVAGSDEAVAAVAGAQGVGDTDGDYVALTKVAICIKIDEFRI